MRPKVFGDAAPLAASFLPKAALVGEAVFLNGLGEAVLEAAALLWTDFETPVSAANGVLGPASGAVADAGAISAQTEQLWLGSPPSYAEPRRAHAKAYGRQPTVPPTAARQLDKTS